MLTLVTTKLRDCPIMYLLNFLIFDDIIMISLAAVKKGKES